MHDETQYELQAYGEEANQLYKEAYRCIICASPPRKPKRSVIVEETIDGENYIFDSNVCALIFKRLRIVMGEGVRCIDRIAMFKSGDR